MLALSVLALVGLSREIGDYYARQIPASPNGSDGVVAGGCGRRHRLVIAEYFTYSALWMAYGALLWSIGFWRRSAFFRWQALFLIAATIVKVFIYDVSQLDRGYRILSFMILGVLLLAVSFVYQTGLAEAVCRRKREKEAKDVDQKVLFWLSVFLPSCGFAFAQSNASAPMREYFRYTRDVRSRNPESRTIL